MTEDREAPHSAAPAELLVIRVQGSGSAALAEALARFETACAVERPFGALVDGRKSEDDHGNGRAPEKLEMMRRLRSLRPAMQRHSRGVAFLVTPEELAKQRNRLRAAAVVLGCPVDAFDSATSATAWLAEHGVAESPLS